MLGNQSSCATSIEKSTADASKPSEWAQMPTLRGERQAYQPHFVGCTCTFNEKQSLLIRGLFVIEKTEARHDNKTNRR